LQGVALTPSIKAADRCRAWVVTRTRSGVVAVLGTTATGHKNDVVGINELLMAVRQERHLDIPIRGRRQRRFRVALPVPVVGVGIPARARALG